MTSTCVLIILIILQFAILFPKFVYPLETGCLCGRADEDGDCIDADLVEFVVQETRQLAGPFIPNYQYCYEYRLLSNGNSCPGAIPFVSKEINPASPLQIGSGNVDGVPVEQYKIVTPMFYESGKCYSSQIYCIANIVCTNGGKIIAAQIQNPGRLTMNSGDASKPCKDSLTYYEFEGGLVTGDRDTSSFCGADAEPDTEPQLMNIDEILNNEIELHFFSSQCCQSCGRSIQYTCIPSLQGPIGPVVVRDLNQKILYKKLFLTAFNKQLLYHVKKIIIVPGGSKLSFQSHTITITTSNIPTITINGIYHLLVFDEDSVCYYSFWRGSSKIFNSGVLYIGLYNAWFIATENESPVERRTARENAFLQEAVLFVDTVYNNDPEIIPLTKAEIEANKYVFEREYRPRCAESNNTSRRCRVLPCPELGQLVEIFADARDIRKSSNNFLVNAYANLVINTITAAKNANHKKGIPGSSIHNYYYTKPVAGAPGPPGPMPGETCLF